MLASYDDDLAHELNNMTKKTAVQMMYGTVNGKDHMSVITFLQDLKAAYDACDIYDEAAMRLSRYYWSDLVKSVITARVALPTDTAKPQ